MVKATTTTGKTASIADLARKPMEAVSAHDLDALGELQHEDVVDGRMTCAELARIDLTPAPGDEIVSACRDYGCSDPDWMDVLVVTSAAAASPVAAIGTTSDMACLSPTFRRRTIVLEGLGEDLSFRATFAWRNGAMRRIATRVGHGAVP